MGGTKDVECEMLKLLKIRMCCCEWRLEKTWDLRKAVKKIQELKEKASEYDDLSSNASEGEFYISRAMTEYNDFSNNSELS
ncbi:hypothetical protein M5689_012114 [Euphorbia peplus]|nr:hypothetical protein M5689_012114 [Euphorbia peplus]